MVDGVNYSVGVRDVTKQIESFANQKAGKLMDGAFSKAEKSQYMQVLTHLNAQGLLSKEDCALFKEFIVSSCTSSVDKNPLFLALRETVIGFIESDKYDNAPKAIQAAAAFLAGDLTVRINQQRIVLKSKPNLEVAAEKIDPLKPDQKLQQLAREVGASCGVKEVAFTDDSPEKEEEAPGGVFVAGMDKPEPIGDNYIKKGSDPLGRTVPLGNFDPRFR